jgi:hypothetical protein
VIHFQRLMRQPEFEPLAIAPTVGIEERRESFSVTKYRNQGTASELPIAISCVRLTKEPLLTSRRAKYRATSRGCQLGLDTAIRARSSSYY